ncbi:hypothetical protein ABZP36_019160 [Zizania latifolia]
MSKVLERRNSFDGSTTTSSASDSRKDEKTTSRYLRASTGSCHDLCKHGHRSPFEEEKKLSLSRGRRKKLPSHLNNLTLHRSAILDRSKDVKHTNLSLVKSSISLGESDHVAPKKTQANSKGVASSEHLVSRAASSADHKNVNPDGRKKHPTVAQNTPLSRYSNEVPRFDQKPTMPVKGAIMHPELKLAQMTMPKKSRTVEKITTVKQPSLKRPASFPTKLNRTKQMPVPSQASNHLLSSKTKCNVKRELTSPPVTITGVRVSNSGKTGRSPMSSGKSSINGKEGLDIPRSSFSVEPKISVSAVIQDGVQDSFIRGHHVESTLAEVPSDNTECVDESRPAPEETIRSISMDEGTEGNGTNEESAGEGPMQSSIVLDLLQTSNDQELKTALSRYDSMHNQAGPNAISSQVSGVEDSQTDASPCQLSKQLTAVENAVVCNSLSTENSLEVEADGVKVITSVEFQFPEGNEEMGSHEGLEESTEQLALDEKHAEEPRSCLGSTSGNATENVKASEIFEAWINNSPSHCQSISDASSYSELLEDPKSMRIEPSDYTVQTDELVIASNDNTFEQDQLKPRFFLHQSPEELSDDEFYEEFDSELSESDESGTEDGGETINKNSDDYLGADGQRPRRISTLEQDDASATPYRLKFKRGKIVELQPDSNGPRRLKFRRRAANEVSSSAGQPARRVYKKNNTKDVGSTNLDVDESPSVKLRHQDTHEKKDAQGLFNNVIEETASKLVESRKSKVKALVGAFETVISLQDGKPTSSTPQAGNSLHSFHGDEGNAPEEAA